MYVQYSFTSHNFHPSLLHECISGPWSGLCSPSLHTSVVISLSVSVILRVFWEGPFKVWVRLNPLSLPSVWTCIRTYICYILDYDWYVHIHACIGATYVLTLAKHCKTFVALFLLNGYALAVLYSSSWQSFMAFISVLAIWMTIEHCLMCLLYHNMGILKP